MVDVEKCPYIEYKIQGISGIVAKEEKSFCVKDDLIIQIELKQSFYLSDCSFALTQELRAKDNVIAVIFFTNTCSEANRNRRLDYHDCFRVILNHQLDNRFNRRSIKEILLAVVVSALKFVRRSCSTVAYKAHLLPYVATYPLFRA